MLPTNDLRSLQGRQLIAADGDKLGGIEEIYCDKATNEPEWFGINAGFLGTKRLVVPVEGATLDDDGIHVPYTSDLVKDAPGVDMKEITEEAEADLYRYYGIHFSRAESPTILPASGPEPAAPDPSYAEPANAGGPVLTPGTVQPIPSAAIAPVFSARDRWDLDEATGTAADVPRNKADSMRVRSLGTAPDRGTHDGDGVHDRAGSVRAFLRDAPLTAMLPGAIAGAVATLPMTGAMIGLQRLLPGERPLPPREITTRAARQAGAEAATDTEPRRRMLTTIAHAGFGAASGALYSSTIGNTRVHPVVAGAAYGAGLWTVSYAGWLPASGLYPQVTKVSRGRNAMMLAANVLWGIAAASMARRMRKPATDFKLAH